MGKQIGPTKPLREYSEQKINSLLLLFINFGRSFATYRKKIILTKKIVPSEARITKPILTKYERVRILGERRQQLILGAKPMIKNTEGMTSEEIAKLEITNKVIPIIIERLFPDGHKELWNIKELTILN